MADGIQANVVGVAAGGTSGATPRGGISSPGWVADNGVPGEVAPFDFGPNRKPLWAAKCMKQMGKDVPADLATRCPRGKFIGVECPLCGPNQPQAHKWYMAQDDPNFDGRFRPKGLEGRGTRIQHTLEMCPMLRKEVHEWVRAHPDDRWMFDKLPDNQEPGALP